MAAGSRARRARTDAPATPAGDGPAYVAELIGTFTLVFFIVCAISVTVELQQADFVVIGLVHAFVLLLLIHSLGGVSGAHFNPAVTIALLVARKIAPPQAMVYVAAQVVGAVLATLLARALFTDEGGAISYGATLVNEASFLDGGAIGGLVVEFIGTFFLMWAIMAMAVNPRSEKDWAGLVIGTTLGFGVMAFGPVTGAGFNPARSFGPALVSGEFADFWIYVIGPVLGAIAAAVLYTLVVLIPLDRVGERPVDKLD